MASLDKQVLLDMHEVYFAMDKIKYYYENSQAVKNWEMKTTNFIMKLRDNGEISEDVALKLYHAAMRELEDAWAECFFYMVIAHPSKDFSCLQGKDVYRRKVDELKKADKMAFYWWVAFLQACEEVFGFTEEEVKRLLEAKGGNAMTGKRPLDSQWK